MPKFIRRPDGTLQPIPDTEPIPAPQDFEDGQQPVEQPQERPESEKRIRWLQEPNDKFSDGISDLFEAPDQEEIEDDMDDLTSVDEEVDIIDGPIDDLTDVDLEKDIMGFEGTDRPAPKPRYRIPPNGRKFNRYTPPTSIRGMGG